jgi:hypothetical protein
MPFLLVAHIVFLSSVIVQTRAARADSIAFTQLTVPESRLAGGCRIVLSPTAHLPGNQGRAEMWAGLPIPTNPWIGADRRIVAAIREQVDPPPLTPDPPALDSRGAAAFRLRLADGIEVAYVGGYGSDDPFLVVVLALRLTEDRKPLALSNKSRRSATRMASGRTLIEVSGEQSRCCPARRRSH